MNHLIPPVGTKGLFRLKSPFDTLLLPVEYQCIAVRKLSDFDANGVSPNELFYTPYFNDDTEWLKDSADPESCIITIVSESGMRIDVPSRFILAYPNLNGVPYTVRVVGANLGPIPDDLDLTPLFNKIKDIIRDTLGIQTQVLPVVISDMSLIPKEQHESLVAARAAIASEGQTELSKILQLQRELTALRETNEALVTYIKQELGSLP